MPIHDPLTSVKYAHIKTTGEIETVISEIIKNAENIKDKKLSLTLLSDVFFKNEPGEIYASYMSERLIIPPHNHDYYELNLVLSGQCVEIIGDNIIILEEGDILFMPPSAVHATGVVGDSIGINLLFKQNFITGTEKKLALSDKNNYLSNIMGQKSYMVFRAKDSLCPENAKRLAELFSKKDIFPAHYEIYAEAIALLILIELCHVEREDYLFELPKATHSVDTADAILGYIRDNISSANLENTAKHFGYSPVHLSRIIKKHTGSSFAKFILL
jgi:quercetin dioxygenase-like cupin family protein